MGNAIIVETSLAETLDRLNDAMFFRRKISANDRKAVSEWIASRQGGTASYRGMFSPTHGDVENGFKLFTGEKITSQAQLRHILGEESIRALALLNVKSATVSLARRNAAAGFLQALELSSTRGESDGWFCCGTCTPAFWRNLVSGGLDDVLGGRDKALDRLAQGMKVLEKHRDGKGKWKRFPFYYTLLALIEIPDLAGKELKYVSPVCETIAGRKLAANADRYSIRKMEVIRKVFE